MRFQFRFSPPLIAILYGIFFKAHFFQQCGPRIWWRLKTVYGLIKFLLPHSSLQPRGPICTGTQEQFYTYIHLYMLQRWQRNVFSWFLPNFDFRHTVRVSSVSLQWHNVNFLQNAKISLLCQLYKLQYILFIAVQCVVATADYRTIQ